MSKFALYDPKITVQAPVIGWYDFDALHYPTKPPSENLIAVPDDVWAARTKTLYAVTDGKLVPFIQTLVASPPPSAPSTADLLARIEALETKLAAKPV